MKPRVLIFAKAPFMGVSKTRLARGLGTTEARRLARMSFTRTLQVAKDPRWTTLLYAAPDRVLGETLGGLWPRSLERRSQGRGDLGARLARGYAEAPVGSPVILIGADAPDVSTGLLWAAIRALKTHEFVVGPSSDGGFWLLGLKRDRRARHPFNQVRWSSPHTLGDVKANFPKGARVAELPILIDLDEAEDWQSWASNRQRRGAGGTPVEVRSLPSVTL
ncbi:MAG: TIGR04282 family arsenosugar biosynthesis glycosyltransferase [Pseudomonadota bacterium]